MALGYNEKRQNAETNLQHSIRPEVATMQQEPLRITLLGEMTVQRYGQPSLRFPTKKTAILRAYLALYPQRAHTRQEIAALLWPEVDPAAGRASLRQALSVLR